MKWVTILLALGIASCARPIPRECSQIPVAVATQQRALREIGSALSAEKIEWSAISVAALKARHENDNLIEACISTVIELGPDCREFHQLGALQDSNSVTRFIAEAAKDPDDPRNQRLARQFVDAANKSLDDSNEAGQVCFKQ